jgi:hypothetical protein
MVLLSLLLSSCRQEQAPQPMEFIAYEHNPVLM